jgi:hypothetical protein
MKTRPSFVVATAFLLLAAGALGGALVCPRTAHAQAPSKSLTIQANSSGMGASTVAITQVSTQCSVVGGAGTVCKLQIAATNNTGVYNISRVCNVVFHSMAELQAAVNRLNDPAAAGTVICTTTNLTSPTGNPLISLVATIDTANPGAGNSLSL